MENEIMNYENEVMEDEIEVVETEGSGMSTGMAMLIGGGLALAATAVVNFAKKAWTNHKAKKELHQPAEGDIIEVTNEQVVEVAE